MTRISRRFSLLCLLASLVLASASLQAEPPQSGTKDDNADLAQSLIGAWVHVGKPGEVVEPMPGARMKFWGAKHWVITQADPATGVTIFHHGGTYTLDGDRYVETITFANESTKDLIGTELKFTIKVEGDEYTQTGDGNPFTEVWKRMKK